MSHQGFFSNYLFFQYCNAFYFCFLGSGRLGEGFSYTFLTRFAEVGDFAIVLSLSFFVCIKRRERSWRRGFHSVGYDLRLCTYHRVMGVLIFPMRR